MKIYWMYLKSLLWHKYYVFIAGRKLGGLSMLTLLVHDWQKFTPSEFPVYAKYFFDGKNNKEAFMYTWLHHWEYWLLNPKYTFSRAKDGQLPIPEKYVREMVADWMGASKIYTSSWDMSEWLNLHLEDILSNMHADTVEILDCILSDLGYVYDTKYGWMLK